MFLHRIVMIEKAIQKQALKCTRLFITETLNSFTFQKISKAWKALAKTANLAPLANLVSLYVLFDLEKKQYIVLSKREQGVAPRE